MSLPSRERGLKYSLKSGGLQSQNPSLPSRERGLKCPRRIRILHNLHVAPLAGAWIEIESTIYSWENGNVAPLAGAWIEII